MRGRPGLCSTGEGGRGGKLDRSGRRGGEGREGEGKWYPHISGESYAPE